jgi:hypothetical protein
VRRDWGLGAANSTTSSLHRLRVEVRITNDNSIAIKVAITAVAITTAIAAIATIAVDVAVVGRTSPRHLTTRHRLGSGHLTNLHIRYSKNMFSLF